MLFTLSVSHPKNLAEKPLGTQTREIPEELRGFSAGKIIELNGGILSPATTPEGIYQYHCQS